MPLNKVCHWTNFEETDICPYLLVSTSSIKFHQNQISSCHFTSVLKFGVYLNVFSPSLSTHSENMCIVTLFSCLKISKQIEPIKQKNFLKKFGHEW